MTVNRLSTPSSSVSTMLTVHHIAHRDREKRPAAFGWCWAVVSHCRSHQHKPRSCAWDRGLPVDQEIEAMVVAGQRAATSTALSRVSLSLPW